MPGRLQVLVLAAIVGRSLIPASAAAQVQVATVEELRGELAPKDVVSIVQVSGDIVAGQLVRFGDIDLEIRAQALTAPGQLRPFRTLTVPHAAIRSIERLRDPTKNGALIGAGIGAGFSLAMFIHAVAVDRNEMDEWAASYLVRGGVFTGLGALVGWVVDSLDSKPRIRFDVAPTGTLVASQDAQRPRSIPRRERERQRRHVVIGGDFGWVKDSETLDPSPGLPLIEARNVGVVTTARSVSAGVFLRPNLSVWGEATQLSPSTVAYTGMSLCVPTFSGRNCTPLSDWPGQSQEGAEIVRYSHETQMPYSVSGFVGYHPRNWGRVHWTLLGGLTVRPRDWTYDEQAYEVTGPGVFVPKTRGLEGGTRRETHVALGLGVDPQIFLSSHLAVIPKVRFDLGPEMVRLRAGTGVQWTF